MKLLKYIIVIFLFVIGSDLKLLASEKNPQLKNKKTETAIFHTVKAGETLYRISKNYNVTPVQIKKWNKLKGESIQLGQKLIVGYEKKKRTVESKKIEPKLEPNSVAKPIPPVKKTEPTLPIEKAQPVIKKEEPAKSAPAKQQEISEKGTAAWIDDEEINSGKYYALHRTAPTGTIIKVTNLSNQKSVYVKVVGKIPDRQENQNVIIRISKKAADALNVSGDSFEAELVYTPAE